MGEMFKNLVLWLIIGLLLMAIFTNFGPKYGQPTKLDYSQFVEKINNKEIKRITIDTQTIEGITNAGETFLIDLPAKPELALLNEWITKYDLVVKARPPEQQSMLLHIFISWFPVILFIGVWIFFMRQMQGTGGRSAMSFGRSRARLMGEDQVKVTFADVAGVDEAKAEVAELVDFLKDPNKFYKLGGKIPRGVLMIGPPGTGKTLLAKAIAGEARVPFFTISGSDFVEMFVGVGASRVRDMFEQAKKCAPCIIFIDEIDAVGRHRGAGLGGGHDEREQTLNQLLVEMDGFDANDGVIVIAATNRPDVLDPALLRPGRFDRRVVVNLPDLRGREQILNVHLLKISLQPGSVNAKAIARGTPGFSGADLANLVNEAALLAARANKNFVSMAELEKSKDKIIMGVERRSLAISEKERSLTAYHEAGHAIVGLIMPGQDPVYKVTIIPRELALGVTFFLPENDAYSVTRQQLEGKVASAFGGRVAEELIFGSEQVTTGASNDIKKATEICRNMVTKWGLSEKLGPLSYRDDDGEVFLGHSIAKHKEVSESTAQLIDQEVRMIIDRGYTNARKILEDHLAKLHMMAKSLLKYETLDAAQVKEIMEGKEPSPPAGWSDGENRNDQDRPNINSDGTRKEKEDPAIIKYNDPDPKNANLGSV